MSKQYLSGYIQQVGEPTENFTILRVSHPTFGHPTLVIAYNNDVAKLELSNETTVSASFDFGDGSQFYNHATFGRVPCATLHKVAFRSENVHPTFLNEQEVAEWIEEDRKGAALTRAAIAAHQREAAAGRSPDTRSVVDEENYPMPGMPGPAHG